MTRTTGEGTKIAQAAKELNVTSVTIRRYISEFNIETTSDENGVKVLPVTAMEELREIRRLKEEGLTNPRVLELLEETRAKQPRARARGKEKERTDETALKSRAGEPAVETGESTEPRTERQPARKTLKAVPAQEVADEVEEAQAEEAPGVVAELSAAAADRSKHLLTCQTCGKHFEHMNPRLRDCLDCYRTKRRERRRGGVERHKSVIQHPLAQQAASKSASHVPPGIQPAAADVAPAEEAHPADQAPAATSLALAVSRQPTIRNYRKAIEETRQITSNLKRRLERPDLPEGERRWLEQIYAYELILHQGWRHLAEYKAQTQQQSRVDNP